MVQLEDLKPEEVSLAFLCLVGKRPLAQLPPHLKVLTQEQWECLARLLHVLESEQSQASIH